jgi:serine/threonine-protein kinase RsbT
VDVQETRLAVRTQIDVARAALHAGRCCTALGFDPARSQMVATAVSELAGNVIKFANRGEVVVRGVTSRGRKGVEVVVSDNGPGIADVEQAVRDHFSTSGTLGLGLPGVRRMMDEFSIESAPGRGTTVVVCKWL